MFFTVWVLHRLLSEWPDVQHQRVHHGPVQQVDDTADFPAQVSDQEAEDDLPLQVRGVRSPRGAVHGAIRGSRQRPERHHRGRHQQPQDPGASYRSVAQYY